MGQEDVESSSKLSRKYQQKKAGILGSLDDCDRPACDDMLTKLNKAAAAAGSSKDDECPVTSSILGKATWTMLHTMAAWYPEQPTREDEKEMRHFISALARFYPCSWCAQDFQENIQKEPVRTSTRADLCQWLCKQHNVVNEKTGKPLFSCDMKDLDERWRKSKKDKCKSTHMGPH